MLSSIEQFLQILSDYDILLGLIFILAYQIFSKIATKALTTLARNKKVKPPIIITTNYLQQLRPYKGTVVSISVQRHYRGKNELKEGIPQNGEHFVVRLLICYVFAREWYWLREFFYLPFFCVYRSRRELYCSVVNSEQHHCQLSYLLRLPLPCRR